MKHPVSSPSPIMVIERAAEVADVFGIDVEEALSRWECAGGADGGEDAGTWLSVAFMFSRHERTRVHFAES